jgi:hypothetical protein
MYSPSLLLNLDLHHLSFVLNHLVKFSKLVRIEILRLYSHKKRAYYISKVQWNYRN